MRCPRVLLIDDESSLREAVAEMLTFDGLDVVQAGRVDEALQIARRESFDVVVTDLRLPDGCGLDVLAEVRDRDPQFVAIVTSGFGTFANAVDAISMRVAAFLTKPFSILELSRSIRETVPSAGVEYGETPSARSIHWTVPSDDTRRLIAHLEDQLTCDDVHRHVASRAVALAREVVTNCARHAYTGQPGPVKLLTRIEDDSLVLVVSDEGKGMDVAEAVRRGAGIVRLHRLADEVRVHSVPGRGTTVYLRLRNALDTGADTSREATDDQVATSLLWS